MYIMFEVCIFSPKQREQEKEMIKIKTKKGRGDN